MRISTRVAFAVAGFLLCGCRPRQISQIGMPKAATDSTPLGHIGPGCRYAGAASFDVFGKNGTIEDSIAARANEGTLVLAVSDIHSQIPLSGAEGSILIAKAGLISARDTTGSGSVRLSGIRAGVHLLRVRRIGYVMMQGFALVRAGMSDTLVVSLNGDRKVFGDIGC